MVSENTLHPSGSSTAPCPARISCGIDELRRSCKRVQIQLMIRKITHNTTLSYFGQSLHQQFVGVQHFRNAFRRVKSRQLRDARALRIESGLTGIEKKAIELLQIEVLTGRRHRFV